MRFLSDEASVPAKSTHWRSVNSIEDKSSLLVPLSGIPAQSLVLLGKEVFRIIKYTVPEITRCLIIKCYREIGERRFHKAA